MNKNVLEDLAWKLRGNGKTLVKKSRIKFRTLPLSCPVRYKGKPAVNLIYPTLPAQGVATENIFDSWLYSRKTGTGDSKVDLYAAWQDASLYDFIDEGADFSEKTVRLLAALGSAEGATLHYGDRSILVTHDGRTYGIHQEGITQSRFSSGLALPCAPREIMDATKEVALVSMDFVSLYREAYRKGGGALEALIAVYMWDKKFNFSRLSEGVIDGRLPPSKLFVRLEHALDRKIDPVAYAYKLLVPRWLTRQQFSYLACSLDTRPLGALDALSKQKYLHAVIRFFKKRTQ